MAIAPLELATVARPTTQDSPSSGSRSVQLDACLLILEGYLPNTVVG